ncbi:MAG: hypothetical protein LBP60_05630 [Spirochaetaceae bacterium]|jgi:hypothetical protein|nr:hypothetical protein [Spirochaetaceae bacterium]
MTLAQRNYYFKGGIVLSALCFLCLIALAGKLLPLYPVLSKAALYRSEGLFQNLVVRFFNTAPQASFASVAAAVTYALGASILVFVFFEKTQSPEILFFGLFGLSFAFEILRILLPLQEIYNFPSVLLVMGTRLLFSGRLFGVLSLFASSLHAAGLEMQKQGKVILTIVIAILVISSRVPINGLAWDSSLTMVCAYSSMFRLVEYVLMAMAVISFLLAAYTKGTGEYLFIALGTFLVSLGRSLLINADTWLPPLPGLLMLIAGTWFITGRLHQVYLWL